MTYSIGIAHYRRPYLKPIRELIQAVKKKGAEAIPFRLADITVIMSDTERFFAKKVDLSRLDGLFLRTLGAGNCDQITFRISALDHLEQTGVYVMNSTYPFRRTKDKYNALYALRRDGLPVPDTVVTESANAAIRTARKYKDVVIKPLVGSQGLGVYRAFHPDLAFRAIKFLRNAKQVMYVQKNIEKPGQDLRVFVIGGEIIGAMYRRSKDWKTNIARGAKPILAEIGQDIAELAIRATETLELEYAGVDLIETPKGPVILEVNAAPSWSGIQQVTKLPIADLLVDHMIKQLKT